MADAKPIKELFPLRVAKSNLYRLAWRDGGEPPAKYKTARWTSEKLAQLEADRANAERIRDLNLLPEEPVKEEKPKAAKKK